MGLGGDIFPSGHTANAVVTWGILAYLASTPGARRWLSAASAVVSLGVGLTTVYLGTHWLSDVLLGWAAGLLILLALPWCEPLIARAEVRSSRCATVWRARSRPTAPAPGPVAGPPRSRCPCSHAPRGPGRGRRAARAGLPGTRAPRRPPTWRRARTRPARSAPRSPRSAAAARRTPTASRAAPRATARPPGRRLNQANAPAPRRNPGTHPRSRTAEGPGSPFRDRGLRRFRGPGPSPCSWR